MLIDEIKIENRIWEMKEKVKFLEIYGNEELERMKSEIKEILNSKYLTSSETSELRNIYSLISNEKIRRERWKIDYFYPIIQKLCLTMTLKNLLSIYKLNIEG